MRRKAELTKDQKRRFLPRLLNVYRRRNLQLSCRVRRKSAPGHKKLDREFRRLSASITQTKQYNAEKEKR